MHPLRCGTLAEMKTALITTTINTPHVLALYRNYGPDVRFFVAGDLKTPTSAIELCGAMDGCAYFGVEFQKKWKCSDLLGWNCIQRRNIALLEALRWGADSIVTIDDDNIPLDNQYFFDFQRYCWYQPFEGLKASSPTNWFDVGTLLQPISPHRGFPHVRKAQPYFEHVVDTKVGVAAGICMGDPDISAVTRIANGPTVHGASELLRAGIVTDPRQTWTVFNTQNTAFISELAPAMFCPPGLGRYDDIVASLVTQRIMREKGYHVHFGKPFVWQQRNAHDLTKDLIAETWGMRNIENVAAVLDALILLDRPVTEQVRQIYLVLEACNWFPTDASAAALAFCDDVEKVL